jgi:hypothetical protein
MRLAAHAVVVGMKCEYESLIGRAERNEILEDVGGRREDNKTMSSKEIGYKTVADSSLSVSEAALVQTVINFRILQKVGKLLISSSYVRFS